MEKLKNPYMHIELSTDTESENEQETYDQTQTQTKVVHVQSAKSKKYQQFNDIESKILEFLDQKKFNELQTEYINFQNLLDKNQAFINKRGIPKSFLRTINKLNQYFFEQNQDIEDSIQDGSDLKGVKFVKQRLKKKYQELENLISQQIEKGELDENEVSEYEEIDINQKKDAKRFDDDDYNFAKRLTLSPEERRKFWLVKKKDVVKTKKDRKQHENEERKKKINFDKVFKEEKDEFYNFSLKRLPRQFFQFTQQKNSQNFEDLDKNIRFLDTIIERLEELQKNKDYKLLSQEEIQARYVESMYIYLDFMFLKFQQQGVLENDQFEDLFSFLKILLKQLQKNDNIQVFNYNRGEDVKFTRKQLVSYFNNYLIKTQEEIKYALKLNDPFSSEFVQILQSQLSFFLEFLDSVIEFYEKEFSEQDNQNKFISQMKFMQIEQLYYVSDEFVVDCRQLSEYFEEIQVSEQVEKLYQELTKINENEKQNVQTNLYYCFNSCINNKNLDKAFEILKNFQTNKKLRTDHYQLALFNRAIAVLGMGYFKCGEYNKSKGVLSNLCNSGKAMQNFYQYDPFKENILDQENPLNMFPFYMHLNLQEIDDTFLIACVLSEAHKTVNHQQNLKLSNINKRFMNFLKFYQQNLFINSQNNNSDCVYICYRSLLMGDYQKAFESLKNTTLLKEQDNYSKKILEQLKLESLLCYLEFLKSQEVFQINIEDLCEMFQLQKEVLKQQLQQKIQTKEISGQFLDQESLFEINNTASDIFQTEEENQFLEQLIKAHQYIDKYSQLKNNNKELDKNDLQTLNQICHQNFKSSKNQFNFGYNFNDVYAKN